MAFEIFKKLRTNLRLIDNVVSVRGDALYFGLEIGASFEKFKYINILIDKDNKKIAIKGCEQNSNAFRILKRVGKAYTTYHITCKNVARRIIPNHYPAIYENNMWVFKYVDKKDEDYN